MSHLNLTPIFGADIYFCDRMHLAQNKVHMQICKLPQKKLFLTLAHLTTKIWKFLGKFYCCCCCCCWNFYTIVLPFFPKFVMSSGSDPEFLKRGVPNLRTDKRRTCGVKGCLRGMCPIRSKKKKIQVGCLMYLELQKIEGCALPSKPAPAPFGCL